MGIDSSKISFDTKKEKSTNNERSGKNIDFEESRLNNEVRDTNQLDTKIKTDLFNNCSDKFKKNYHKQSNVKIVNQKKESNHINTLTSSIDKNDSSKVNNEFNLLDNQMQNFDLLSTKNKINQEEAKMFENCSTNITSNCSNIIEMPVNQKTFINQQQNPPIEERTKNIKFNDKITCFRIINENANLDNKNLNALDKNKLTNLTKVKIEWIEGGNNVFLAGSYNNWELTKLVYNSITKTHFCELVSKY